MYSLIDMLNLAGTRLILGSGYSSYSEVAAQIGGVRVNLCPSCSRAAISARSLIVGQDERGLLQCVEMASMASLASYQQFAP